MNWIFLLIGTAIGFITGYYLMVVYVSANLYGRMMVDKRDPDRFIFRLEFTKDPTTIRRKYIVLKVEETELKSIQDE